MTDIILLFECQRYVKYAQTMYKTLKILFYFDISSTRNDIFSKLRLVGRGKENQTKSMMADPFHVIPFKKLRII